MLIGCDLDNTVICYDGVFDEVGRKLGFLPAFSEPLSKAGVRAFLRAQGDEGELSWQRLQGQVYGNYLHLAKPFEGVAHFFYAAKKAGHSLCIISHKTQFGHFDETKTDLRLAALGWLENNGILPLVGKDNVFFAATREQKIARIVKQNPACFIDDLPELFTDAAFPESVQKILFAPDGGAYENVTLCRSFVDVAKVCGLD